MTVPEVPLDPGIGGGAGPRDPPSGVQEEVGPPVDVASGLHDEWDEVGLVDVLRRLDCRVGVGYYYVMSQHYYLCHTFLSTQYIRTRGTSGDRHPETSRSGVMQALVRIQAYMLAEIVVAIPVCEGGSESVGVCCPAFAPSLNWLPCILPKHMVLGAHVCPFPIRKL